MAEKNKEDSLFQLIRSMNKAEKRYFRINNTHVIGEKNSYMRLYDALEKLDEYDDAKFRQKFKKEPFVKYLAAEKNYLYEQILKSLRAFRSERSNYTRLIGLIQDIDLLYEKRLYEECEKRVRKAQKIAIEMNYFQINAMLIDWKLILLTRLEDREVEDTIKQYYSELEENDISFQHFHFYRKLKNEVMLISKKGFKVLHPVDKMRLEEVFNLPQVQNPEWADSFSAKQEYYTLMGRLYYTKNHYEEEHRIRVKQLQLFDENPEMKDEYLNKYYFTLAHFLQVSVRVNDFEGYERAIEQLGLGDSPEHFKEMKVINLAGNQMFYLMNNSRWPEAVKLSNILEDIIVKYRPSISWTQVITIKYNAGCLQFILGKYSDAVDRFDYIINEKQETYIGQLLASRILHVICHYEISPPTVVEYLLGSAMRFASKIEHNNTFNDIILKGIRKLTRTIDKGETRQIMTQMRDDLLAIFEQYQFGLGLEETICWLISRIENRPVIDVVNERLEVERQMAVEKLKQAK